jgi:ferritin-like metal-binding protein YciE
MPAAKKLHDAFLDELRDAYDAEKQLTKALPKMAKAATSPDLRAAFEAHLEETREHVTRLENVFANLDEKVRGKHCDGIAGIIEEGQSVMEEDFDDATMDACLIAGGQRAEHYEIAAYGSLIAWAEAMGHKDAIDLLQETLDEEKAADEKLSSLAEGGINQEAADASTPDEEEEDAREEDDEDEPDDEKKPASITRAKAKTAVARTARR